MKKVTLLFGVFVAAAIAGFFFLDERPDRQSPSRSIRNEMVGNEISDLTRSPKGSVDFGSGKARKLIGVTLAEKCVVKGKVVERGSGKPLLAALRTNTATWSTSGDGTFAFGVQRDATIEIYISSKFHETEIVSLQTDVNEADLGDIRLRRKEGAFVQVLDSAGAPVGNARITVPATASYSTWPTQTERVLGNTNAEGQLRLKLTQETIIYARTRTGASELETWFPGSDYVELRMPSEDGAWLGVRDAATGEPLANIPIEVDRAAEYPSSVFSWLSTDDGLNPDPLPAGTYRVRLGAGVNPIGLTTHFANSARLGSSVAVLVELDEPATLWIDVHPSSARSLVLLDAESGSKLVSGFSTLESLEGPPLLATPTWFPLPGESNATDGVIDLSSIEGVIEEQEDSIRIRVSAPGYESVLIESPFASIRPGTSKEVQLTPAELRELILVTTNEEPFHRRVYIRDAASTLLLHYATPGEGGATGRFGWNGQDLVVSESRWPNAEPLVLVSAKRLVSSDRLVVKVDATATIGVDIGEHDPSFIQCASQQNRSEGRSENGLLLFEQLAPGHYEVGPRDVLDTISLRIARGYDSLPINLESGELRVLEWNDEWDRPGVLRGQIDSALASSQPLIVVPRFGGPELPLAGDRGGRRYPIDDDGHFELRGLSATPSTLMFARTTATGGVVPLGWDSMSGTRSLLTARVRLRIKTAEPTSCSVAYAPLLRGRETLGFIEEFFESNQPFELLLPVDTARLTIIVGERTVSRTLNLRTDQYTEIEEAF